LTDDPRRPHEFGWSLSQRRALLALLALLLIYLTVRFAMNRENISDPQPPLGARAAELASRIDPNEADWQTLSTIPTLGEKRAMEIVAYRERVRSATPAATAFQRATDLLHIRGVGAATLENIKPYLVFPGEPTTSSRR